MDFVEIGGKKRPVKFGTNQTAILCELRKTNLKGVENLLKPEKFTSLDIDGTEIRDLVYSGLVAGCKSHKIEVDFDVHDVGDWIDDDPKKIKEILSIYTEATIPKELRAKFREKVQENQEKSTGPMS